MRVSACYKLGIIYNFHLIILYLFWHLFFNRDIVSAKTALCFYVTIFIKGKHLKMF